MSNFLNAKKFLKPCLLGFTLIALLPVIFAGKSEKTPVYSGNSSNLVSYIQDVFADPAKKSRPESPDFLLVQGSFLQAATPPFMVTSQVLGALVGGAEMEDVQKEVVEYTVESGDSLGSIAEKFKISLNTILWVNNLNKNSKIKSGQKLIILPVDGVIYHIKAGDTVTDIAREYKAKIDNIIAFNNLSGDADVFVGDILVIPEGVMPSPVVKYTPPKTTPIASSYFICPISQPCKITQRLHWYNAIDFSHGQCGEPIYAAAGGTVLKVKLTTSTSRSVFGGAGNHITILHPNGVVTMYGHIAASLVNPGDAVSQGQIIALMGGQPGAPGAGMSTGCHVHFQVTGAVNPFAK